MRIIKAKDRWFDFDDDPDGGQIKIRHLNPGDITDIMDAAVEQKARYKKNAAGEFEPEFVQTTDKKVDRELTLQKIIVDWKNFFDSTGVIMECTPANVLRASREIEGFNAAVTRFRNQLASDLEAERGNAEKN